MPRGMHPNSRKALEENRKATQFKSGDNTVERVQKANETKARKRTFREEFEAELAALVKDKSGNMTTTKNAITKVAVQKAMKGDLRALEIIRDTIGEKPVENIAIASIDSDVISEIESMVYDTQ